MGKWSFGPPKDEMQVYSDGTEVPHRYQRVYYNGKIVGYVEIHMHRKKGRDGVTDVSFGVTTVVERPPVEIV